jgi:hypothetical protein
MTRGFDAINTVVDQKSSDKRPTLGSWKKIRRAVDAGVPGRLCLVTNDILGLRIDGKKRPTWAAREPFP